jgi:hypothetical protein
MGKTIQDSNADVQEAIDLAYYVAAEGRRLLGHTVPSEKTDKFAMTLRLTIGVAGLITRIEFSSSNSRKKNLTRIGLWKHRCTKAFFRHTNLRHQTRRIDIESTHSKRRYQYGNRFRGNRRDNDN